MHRCSRCGERHAVGWVPEGQVMLGVVIALVTAQYVCHIDLLDSWAGLGIVAAITLYCGWRIIWRVPHITHVTTEDVT
jgi:hypothetical protein